MTDDRPEEVAGSTPADPPRSWLLLLDMIVSDSRRTRALISLIIILSACLSAILVLIYAIASAGGSGWVAASVGAIASLAVGLRLGARSKRAQVEVDIRSRNRDDIRLQLQSVRSDEVKRDVYKLLENLDEIDNTAIFLSEFRNLEKELQLYYRSFHGGEDDSRFVPLGALVRALEQDSNLAQQDIADIRSVINVRNHAAHGAAPIPDQAAVRDANRKAKKLIELVRKVREP